MSSTPQARRPLRGRLGSLARTPAVLSCLCVALVVLVVLAGNAVYLLQFRSVNPILYHSGLGSPDPGIMRGLYTIDANDGWTAQALGRLSARSWLDGHVPLWNLYEGLGQPLAGEMQSAALFLPFILLQALPNGIFVMHLCLEFVAAFTTLAFLRSLRLSWPAATAGACLFGLCGTFAVMTNAPFNPVAFLPMGCWGIELIAAAVRAGRRPRAGLWVTGFAFAFMLFAGFPEMALLEGILIGVWALIRLIELPGHRRTFTLWSFLSAGVGVALAAPMLVAMKDFLGFGFLAYHHGATSDYSYPVRQITSLALPFAAGPLGNPVTAVQAGYLTLPAVFLAVVGIISTRRPAMHLLLGAVFTVLVLNMFGFQPVKPLLRVLPGVQQTLVAKYGLTLLAFIVVIWAAYGVEALRRAQARRWAAPAALVVTIGYLAATTAYLVATDQIRHDKWTALVLGWSALACVLLAVAVLAARFRPARALVLALVAAAIVVIDGTGNYMSPQVVSSARTTVDLAPIRYLQDNLGTARFFTLGPIQPNYGSYWGLAQLNANDLPVPQKYADFVEDELRPERPTRAQRVTRNFNPYQLVPFNPRPPEQRALLQAYGDQQDAYRTAGVKYLVMSPGVATPATAGKYGLTRVFRSPKAEIWLDPKADPFYTTTGGRCTVRTQSRTDVQLDCAAPARLTRRQLSSPGWTATVNGTDRTVSDAPGRYFQVLDVPAGASTISFSYLPKYFVPATVVSLGLVALMLVDVAAFLVSRRRRRAQP